MKRRGTRGAGEVSTTAPADAGRKAHKGLLFAQPHCDSDMTEIVRARVGILLSMETEHWHGVLRGLAEGFRDAPSVQVVKIARPAVFSATALKRLRLHGVITRVGEVEDEARLLAAGLPVVNVSGRMELPRLNNVINDDTRVGELAAGFFRRRGFTHFGYCGVARHESSRLRGDGFKRALAAHDITAAEMTLPEMPEGDAVSPKVVSRLERWLAPLSRPLALFCFNDAVARAVAEACENAGLRIPDDVAVLGVDNEDIPLGFSPVALSSLELNRREIGFRAAKRLLALLADPALPPETERVPPIKIVARGSTDKLAVNDPVVAEALDMIADHVGNVIYVDDIARTVGVSRRSLEVRFRAALKTSVYAEVQRQQLERAEIMLTETPGLTIAEVAYACGFQDARHLAVVCRRKLDCTPGSLRRGRG